MALQASPQSGRNTLACIFHALPLTIRSKEMTELMHGLKSLVDSIFLTGLSVEDYPSFSPAWGGFAEDMAILAIDSSEAARQIWGQ